MHVKSLKVFCDVVSCRSFSRAADENGISQSSASQTVHQLEQRLGVQLLDRSKRPFVLTAAGKLYYDGCRKFVQHLETLEEDVRALQHEVAGRVNVASIYSIGIGYMDQFVKDFLRRNPKANVRLSYQHPSRVYELVENNQVDVGLVSYPKSSRNISAIPWRDEMMVFVCSSDHPLAQRKSVKLADLQGLDVVAFDEHLKIRQKINKALLADRVDVNVTMEFDNIETLKRALEINAGVSILPEQTVAREVKAGTLSTANLTGNRMVRPVGIIHRRGFTFGKTASEFIRLLQQQTNLDPIPLPTGTTSKDQQSTAEIIAN